MKYLILIIMLILYTSCSSPESLEDNFVNDNDYWAFYDEANPGFYGVYFKFNENGKSDRYCENFNSLEICTGSDVIESNMPWKVSTDSILNWHGMNYYIINSNKSVITLYTGGKIKRHIFLIKEYAGKLRKGKVYYENLDNSLQK